MHKILAKHLKKFGYENGSMPEENIEKFVNFVNIRCLESDEERAFLEHTLETTSQEMSELYETLKKSSATALAKSEARYKELAKKDMLVGILNRRGFQEAFTKIISSSRRANQKFALLFLDLDHFKEVNDTYGHDIGDKLLQEVVSRVSSNIRKEDIFARLGGDEFVIIFTNIDSEHVSKSVEKSLELFQKSWVIDNHTLEITTSIGVTIFPNDADSEKKLLNNADKAMYKSKELGRNKIVYFS